MSSGVGGELCQRGRRLAVIDASIAATGAALGIPVYTQESDLEGLPGVQVIRV